MIRVLPAARRRLIQGAALLSALSVALAVAAAEDAATGRRAYEIVNAVPTFRPMSEIQADIRLNRGRLPVDRSDGLFSDLTPVSWQALDRSAWPGLGFWWAPTELFHQPLYFDDVPLERYGQTPCPPLQPALSGVHFFGSVALLPYKLLADHPCSRISQLGYYRPGSCAPPQREGLRLRPDPN